jgi:hypothetical protein
MGREKVEGAMGIKPSNRAEILKLVLSHVNNGNYDFEGRYSVLGTPSVWDMIIDLTEPGSERENHSLEGAVEEFASDAKVHAGRVQASSRTSLDKSPKFKTSALQNLLPEEAHALHALLEKALQEKSAGTEQQRAPSDSDVADALEAAFAEEVLGKLPKIVSRASELDKLEPSDIRREIPRKDVKKYFQEAHRCYLYGFPVACAVLCRALLESALEEVVDPDRRIDRLLEIEAKNSRRPKQSYIGRLIDEAAKKHILTDDRPRCATEVRDAGNEAIHEYELFEKRLQDPLRGIADIVDSTRKILIDLYSDRS